MIDIDKFEALANEIIDQATSEEMRNWFDGYREKQSLFINFKPIEGYFKSNPIDEILVNENSHKTNSNRYSLAA